MSQAYYDILKYKDFLKRQGEKLQSKEEEQKKGGFFAKLGKKIGFSKDLQDQSTKQAMERLKKKLEKSRIDLARKALDLYTRDEIDLDGGSEIVEGIEAIEAAMTIH